MSTELHVHGGIGQSVKRVEDARFIRGKGNYLDDMELPGMLHMAILRSPHAHARIKSIDTSAAGAMPGVIAVVTGELMAQHKLAWMPTLSGDTQAVLATDKVRFQGQEVAAVIAETKYQAEDARDAIVVEYEVLQAVIEPAAGQGSGHGPDPRRQGRPEGQPHLSLGVGEPGHDAGGVRQGRQGGPPPHLLSALPPCAARDLRVHRRRQPGDRQGHHLHDQPGAARHPHRVRAGDGPAGAEHPHRLAGPRRRLRQQGAGLSRLRRRRRPRACSSAGR